MPLKSKKKRGNSKPKDYIIEKDSELQESILGSESNRGFDEETSFDDIKLTILENKTTHLVEFDDGKIPRRAGNKYAQESHVAASGKKSVENRQNQNFDTISHTISLLGSIDKSPLLRSQRNSVTSSQEEEYTSQFDNTLEETSIITPCDVTHVKGDTAELYNSLFLALFLEIEYPVKVLQNLIDNKEFIKKMKETYSTDNIHFVKKLYNL